MRAEDRAPIVDPVNTEGTEVPEPDTRGPLFDRAHWQVEKYTDP